MDVWFEGSGPVVCSLETVARDVEQLGAHFLGVTGHMPGLTSVELVEEDQDRVVIRTSEGLMTRTNLSTELSGDRLRVEYDEVYDAGSKVSVATHFVDEYVREGGGVIHHIRIGDLKTRGLLGTLYRRFGASKMGAAFLAAAKAHLESESSAQ